MSVGCKQGESNPLSRTFFDGVFILYDDICNSESDRFIKKENILFPHFYFY